MPEQSPEVKIAILNERIDSLKSQLDEMKANASTHHNETRENARSIATIMAKTEEMFTRVHAIMEKVSKIWDWQTGKDRDYANILDELEEGKTQLHKFISDTSESRALIQNLSGMSTRIEKVISDTAIMQNIMVDLKAIVVRMEADAKERKDKGLDEWTTKAMGRGGERKKLLSSVAEKVMVAVIIALLGAGAVILSNYYGCELPK